MKYALWMPIYCWCLYDRMVRPPDPHVGGQQDEDGNPIYAEALMWSGDFTEPRFEDSPPQYPPGMYFTDEQFGQPGGTATMYADTNVAFGRMNTFFFVATPEAVTAWMTILSTRPGSSHGNFAFGMGTGANPAGCTGDQCIYADNGMPTGYLGPP